MHYVSMFQNQTDFRNSMISLIIQHKVPYQYDFVILLLFTMNDCVYERDAIILMCILICSSTVNTNVQTHTHTHYGLCKIKCDVNKTKKRIK